MYYAEVLPPIMYPTKRSSYGGRAPLVPQRRNSARSTRAGGMMKVWRKRCGHARCTGHPSYGVARTKQAILSVPFVYSTRPTRGILKNYATSHIPTHCRSSIELLTKPTPQLTPLLVAFFMLTNRTTVLATKARHPEEMLSLLFYPAKSELRRHQKPSPPWLGTLCVGGNDDADVNGSLEFCNFK